MSFREAAANAAALKAFDEALNRSGSPMQARNVAVRTWLQHRPRADLREAAATVDELVDDARDSASAPLWT